jgi:ABC-type transporter Mla MlaB component
MASMMLRISPRGTVLHLEGQIVGPWVDELAIACDRFQPVALDLTEVTFADRAGLALLKDLKIRMNGLSPFMEEQLKRSVV